MPPYQLQSLGALCLTGPEGELLRGRRRPLVLLVHLARHAPRPVPRSRLAELLWGDREEPRARQSLRQALYDLRGAVGDGLEIDAEQVRLDASTIELDANAFEQDVEQDRLAMAVERWRGDFLAGLEDLGGETYRGWLEAEREGLRRRLAWSLEGLVETAVRHHAREEAMRWAGIWTAAFPFNEEAHACLVRVLASAGRPVDALASHAAFAARLREELAAEPSPSFLQLASQVSSAQGGRPSAGSSALLAPDLVGRDAALAALDEAWAAARTAGVTVLIEGGEGVGRTRLCREFLRRLQEADEPVLVLETRGGGADSDPWATARRLFAGLRHAPGLIAAPDRALAELTTLVPSVRERLPDLPRAGGEPAAVAAAAARVLGDVAAEVPVVVLIDDVSGADAASRTLLQSLAASAPPGVLLLISLRIDAGNAREISDGLREVNGLRRIKLQALSEAHVEAMLQSMLALEEDDRHTLAARLHAETGGNPLHTVEMVSALADTGMLIPGATGVWQLAAGMDDRSIPMPDTIRAAVAARLDHLTAAARSLLDTAAVMTEPVDQHLLLQVSGLAGPQAGEALDELLVRRILRPTSSPEGGLELSQGLMRRVALDALPGERRKRIHRAALRAAARRQDETGRIPLHRDHARMKLPGLRIWLWRHPRPAAAGLFVTIALGSALVLARTAPPTPVVPDAVAIFPFAVRGDEELSYAGQAVASLLATSIDGTSSLRSVDPLRLPAVHGNDDGAVLDPVNARRLATRLGAGLFVLGTVVGSGDRLQATASLYDDAGVRRTVAQATAESDADLFDLTDALARDLLSGFYAGARGELTRVAGSTTSSLAALKEFMVGEGALRNGEYDQAVAAFRRALGADSTFALAAYRMAVAAEWLADAPTMRDALSLALRGRDRLPERYRRLAAADSARHAGAADHAERLYREVAARHPDEALAWYRLGEVLIHFNPLRGRPMAEAQGAFERAVALDPDNHEAQWHLAQLAAAAGDTVALAHRVAPLLTGSAPDRVLWRTVLDVSRADGAKVARDRDSLAAAPDDLAYTVAWFVPLLTRDLAEGARLARLATTPGRAPDWRAGGHVLAAHAELARGRGEAALAELERAGSLRPRIAVEFLASFATLPFVRTPAERLMNIREQLRGWEGVRATAPLVPHLFVSLHEGAHEHLRLYLLGLLAAALGEIPEADRIAAELRGLAGAPHSESFGADLALAVEAEIARLAGEPARALSLLDEMHLRPTNLAVSFSPFYSHARERFVRAELLGAVGRHDEAEAWYASVAESPPFGYLYLGPSLARRAELLDRQGDSAAAQALREELRGLWSDADTLGLATMTGSGRLTLPR